MKDLDQEQAAMLEKLLATTKQAHEYEAKALASKEEVDRLNAERAKIELLVRQATLKILLEEKMKVVAEEIDDRIDRDNRLSDLLASYAVLKTQIEAVDGELRESGRASEVQKILNEVHQRGRQSVGREEAPSVTFVNAVVAEAVREIIFAVPIFGPLTQRVERMLRKKRKH